jgi:hypothetical protein
MSRLQLYYTHIIYVFGMPPQPQPQPPPPLSHPCGSYENTFRITFFILFVNVSIEELRRL